MKKLLIGLFLLLLSFTPLFNVDAYVSVKGYYRSNGTYVAPHVRSNPNGLKYDNYGYKPSQGLYNSSYGTRGSTWDTPTYITDPSYYTGKSLYESNSYSVPSYTPTYTPSYTPTYVPSYTSSYPSTYTGGLNYSKNPKYIKLDKKYDQECRGEAPSDKCREMLSDLVDLMFVDYKIPEKKVKSISISEIALIYAEDNDCDSKFLQKADQKVCNSYLKHKNKDNYEFKTVSNDKRYYQTCGDLIYSTFLLSKDEGKFVCTDGVASLE